MPTPDETRERIRRARQLLLEDWQRAGLHDWITTPAPGAPAAEPVAAAAPRPLSHDRTPQAMAHRPTPADSATSDAAADRLAGNPLPIEERIAALEKLKQQVARCHLCAELAAHRTQTVFGTGNPAARLCFLGEAPGADEDAKGEPFVGRAGQLLNRIIEACQLTREEVYILNVLKCRPPNNRAPLPFEAENCLPFLRKQLEIIRPEFLCCLGASAVRTLLGTNAPLGKMRGQFYRYCGIRVVVTYHPAYLLRNPDAKRAVWEDMQMLMREMDPPRYEKMMQAAKQRES